MKTILPLIFVLVIINTFAQNGANVNSFSGDFSLIKDINPDTDSDPFNDNPNDYYNTQFAILNNVAYFRANNGVNGSELWRSNGTSAGTYMVKDILPGLASSYPSKIVATSNKIFFTTAIQPQLWVSDGTEAGTKALTSFKDTMSPAITNVCAGNNICYFIFTTNYYSSSTRQLWKTDGTIAGTKMVYDFSSITQYNNAITSLVEINGVLYFTAYTTTIGYGIWRSDGTPGGTYYINTSTGSYFSDGPEKLTEYNNRLYFTANDGTGRKIWLADSLGTTLSIAPKMGSVTPTREDTYTYSDNPFVISNNVLYYMASTPETGTELFRYDAKKGAKLVRDLTPGTSSTYLLNAGALKDVNGTVYFAFSGNDSIHLWKTKGTAANTTVVRSFSHFEYVDKLYNANGSLFFVHSDSIYGSELWKSDGTQSGTVMVSDIYPGVNSSKPNLFTFVNKRLLFTAYVPKKGTELWTTDGTAARTTQLKEINSSVTSSSLENNISYRDDYGILPNNAIVFQAYNRDIGHELFYSDGTANGTKLIADLSTLENGYYPDNFLSKNNVVYFTASANPGPQGIYRTDGTTIGTVLMTAINLAYTSASFTATENGNIYYLRHNFSNTKNELWYTTSDLSTSSMLSDKLDWDSYPVAVGNKVYFKTLENGSSYSLSVTDGTVAGTQTVINIGPVYDLFEYKGNLYFGTSEGLWKTNGTQAGTIKLTDAIPSQYYDPYETISKVFCISNDILYFNAYTAANGFELWKTNGTVAGTKIVKNINPGAASSYPQSFTDAKGTLYFFAQDGTGNYGIYKTNGTAAQTQLLAYNDGYLGNIKSIDSTVFFSIHNQLYTTDGTPAGTTIVNTPGMSSLLGVYNLKASGSNLYFKGYSSFYGSELFGGNATSQLVAASQSAAELKYGNDITMSVFPNPATTYAILNVKGMQAKASATLKDLSGRILWSSSFSGDYTTAIDLKNFAKGIYLLTVNSNQRTKTIKLVKQ